MDFNFDRIWQIRLIYQLSLNFRKTQIWVIAQLLSANEIFYLTYLPGWSVTPRGVQWPLFTTLGTFKPWKVEHITGFSKCLTNSANLMWWLEDCQTVHRWKFWVFVWGVMVCDAFVHQNVKNFVHSKSERFYSKKFKQMYLQIHLVIILASVI